jgi:hypothetical protein
MCTCLTFLNRVTKPSPDTGNCVEIDQYAILLNNNIFKDWKEFSLMGPVVAQQWDPRILHFHSEAGGTIVGKR